MEKIETVIFDLGGVLVDWNPRYLYRQLFTDEKEMESFLANIVDGNWNEMQDAGRPFAEGVAERVAKFPKYDSMIRAYHKRWVEMLRGDIPGTVQILKEIHSAGQPRLLALSNWSAETFPLAKQRFPFLGLFETVLVSGEEKLIKPDPRFYRILIDRLKVDPRHAVFIDDVEKNILGAQALGFQTIHFTTPESLRVSLTKMGVLPS
jgi:2-haloacid dehalogenase